MLEFQGNAVRAKLESYSHGNASLIMKVCELGANGIRMLELVIDLLGFSARTVTTS